MWLVHKNWFEDGVPAHTVSIGLRQYAFLDANEGHLDVRNKRDLEELIGRPDIELDYEFYGIEFDAQDEQITIEEPRPSDTTASTGGPAMVEAPTPKTGRTKKR